MSYDYPPPPHAQEPVLGSSQYQPSKVPITSSVVQPVPLPQPVTVDVSQTVQDTQPQPVIEQPVVQAECHFCCYFFCL